MLKTKACMLHLIDDRALPTTRKRIVTQVQKINIAILTSETAGSVGVLEDFPSRPAQNRFPTSIPYIKAGSIYQPIRRYCLDYG